jgi:hypothetical protein
MGRPKKPDKKQISLYVELEKIEPLEEDARKLGFTSIPAMFDEVIKLYFEHWKGERRKYLDQANVADESKKADASLEDVGAGKPSKKAHK